MVVQSVASWAQNRAQKFQHDAIVLHPILIYPRSDIPLKWHRAGTREGRASSRHVTPHSVHSHGSHVSQGDRFPGPGDGRFSVSPDLGRVGIRRRAGGGQGAHV